MNLMQQLPQIDINMKVLTPKKQQTEKKIEYVREYVRLWAFVMLERRNIHTINFIDCMCNAGVYRDGDCCTAIEILQIFLEMASKYQDKNLCIWCNDNDEKKIEILCKIVNLFPKRKNVSVFVTKKDVNKYLDDLSSKTPISNKIFQFGAATILYVDPFDFGTVEIPKVSSVLQTHYCELLFNFFVSDFVRNVNADTGRIAKCLGGKSILSKEDLIAYMRANLRVGNIKYLFAYQFRTLKNVELYQIVFSTPNKKGLEKLKDSLWKVFNGSEFHRNQNSFGQTSFITEQDEKEYALENYAAEAKEILLDQFAGKTISWEELELFLIERTMLMESQILKNVLKPLIREGYVEKCNMHRKNSYKDDKYKFTSQGVIR